MNVIDASVWISGLRAGEIHHRATLDWAQAWTSRCGAFSVLAHFPADVSGALKRQELNIGDLRLVLSEILDGPAISIHPITVALGKQAASIAIETGIRGSDAIYIALASQLHFPLVTWDREQLERGREFADIMTPVQAMERLR